MKNHAADPEIGFLAKSISKPNGCATAMSTAWEIRIEILEMNYLPVSRGFNESPSSQ